MSHKILLIEDEQLLSEILTTKLKNEGYTVLSAGNGEDGMNMIREDNPDLILLDMVMPKMTGYEVLEQMKRDKIKTPVIIISNSGQPVDIEKALSLGAQDYIIKAELDPVEIVKKISVCLNKKLLKENPKQSSGNTVLIAEDDIFLRELCEKKLNRLGYHVLTAVDGIDALEKIRAHKPSIVLLDVLMPGLIGFDVLKEVRADKDESISKIPIIVLSNLGQDNDIRKGKELGANDYLIKADFTIDQIVLKIKKFI